MIDIDNGRLGLFRSGDHQISRKTEVVPRKRSVGWIVCWIAAKPSGRSHEKKFSSIKPSGRAKARETRGGKDRKRWERALSLKEKKWDREVKKKNWKRSQVKMSRQNKDPVHKCHSDPGASGGDSIAPVTPYASNKRISRRHVLPSLVGSPATRKCVLTLDGYSYVIGEFDKYINNIHAISPGSWHWA